MCLLVELVFFFCFSGFLETGDGFLWSKLVVVRNVDEDDDSMLLRESRWVSVFGLYLLVNLLASYIYIITFLFYFFTYQKKTFFVFFPFSFWKEAGNNEKVKWMGERNQRIEWRRVAHLHSGRLNDSKYLHLGIESCITGAWMVAWWDEKGGGSGAIKVPPRKYRFQIKDDVFSDITAYHTRWRHATSHWTELWQLLVKSAAYVIGAKIIFVQIRLLFNNQTDSRTQDETPLVFLRTLPPLYHNTNYFS